MYGLGVLGVMVGGALLEPSSAAACGETPCAQRGETLPRDTASSVPTNTQLRIAYSGFVDAESAGVECEIPIAALRLTADGGDPVELEAEMFTNTGRYPTTWMVAQPDELEPNTRYLVESRLEGAGQCTCEEELLWYEVTRFTTGDGSDDEAPTTPAVSDIEHGDASRNENTCGTTHAFTVSLHLAAPDDASPTTRYDLYVDSEIAQRYLEGDTIQLVVDCIADEDDAERFVATASTLALRTVDLAGNEGERSEVFAIEDRCAAGTVEPEPGVPEDADGGAAEGDAGQVIDRPRVMAVRSDERDGVNEDCSASGSASTGWTAAWLALALALKRRSRKR
jgi:hypothetical protein